MAAPTSTALGVLAYRWRLGPAAVSRLERGKLGDAHCACAARAPSFVPRPVARGGS